MRALRARAFVVAFALVAALPALPAAAQQPQGAPAAQSGESAAAAPPRWPRSFDLPGDAVLQVYQPQVEDWSGDAMSGRAAVAIGPKSGAPTYGMVRFSSRVAVDKPAGLVHFANLSITGVEVPTAPDKAGEIKSAIQAHLPADGMTVPLDQLQASYAVNKELAQLKTQKVDNTPPQILFATTTTVLVPIAGAPVLKSIYGVSDFKRVINTRPLLLLDEASTYHLQAAGTWYEATSLSGTWIVTKQVSDALQAAAKAAESVVAADPLLSPEGKPVTPPPAILVTTEPTELIQTDGQPQMEPVTGTSLLTMSNADHAVFMETTTNTYYVLISGRWFKAADLKGPWAFAPSNALPKDFAKIPPESAKGNVLVSVAGTPQAKEAAIAATIPQTATVKRDVTLTVNYDGGPPQFTPIAGTALLYAVNTPTPVIQLDSERYYAVNDGTWFLATSAIGPWQVATVVPDVIYTIPVSSPLHYVTYVRIYAVTPEAVVVGYTPGYMGVVIAPDGTVVYGTGYSCAGYVGTYWVSCPVTYGLGAGFALGTTEGFAFGFAAGWAWGAAVTPYWGPYWHPYGPYYGPWGGHWGYVDINHTNIYGRWGGAATVNHAWGTTWNGTEWSGRDWAGRTANGTGFAGRSGAAFNPYSGNWAAGRENARYNPATGARGQSAAGAEGNIYRGNAAAGRESTGFNPTSGTFHASQSGVVDNHGNVSAGSRGVAGDVKTGNAVAWDNGHVVADHDGNVYQHTNNGWSQRTSSGWQNVDRNLDTSRLDDEDRARSWGQQRVDNYGAFGRDFGGGDRFGSGGFDRSFGGFGGRSFGGGFGGFRR